MATYPSGTYAPATKSAGQTIAAGFFNDPDNEIIAVEDALLNGFAHGLTVLTGGLSISTGNVVFGQNLSVAGGSTLRNGLVVSSGTTELAGTLDVAGNSTFHGAVTFSSGVTFGGLVLPTVPAVLVTSDTNQNVNNLTWTGLSWNTEVIDNAGMHSTSANSSRITFAASTGLYRVSVSLSWLAGSSGAQVMRVMVNDSSGVAAQTGYSPSAADLPFSLSALVRAASTSDYCTVQVLQASGSTKSIAPSTLYGLSFAAEFVSK